MKYRNALISAAAMGAATLAAQSASAAVVIGGPITVASKSKVTVTFLGSSAGFTSLLGLVGGPAVIFNNKTTPINTTFDLGTFNAGDVLKFSLKVVTTGKTFFSGPAAGNPDGKPHAAFDADTGVAGFEDIFGGGDKDYNDLLFGLSFTAVPEPATWAMMLGGFGLVGASMRRRRTRTAVTYA